MAGALRNWEAVLGAEHVVSEAGALQAAGTATFSTTRSIPAILRPGSRHDVERILRIANQWRVPVYPVSGGRNWGYGSRVPSADHCVLVDLSRMNRILDFDENLAYITVEPGVTQQQAFDFLRQRGSGLWMDSTGAGPDTSLIGNAVERGFGHTPYGDHFSHVCGLEVVLPTGQTLETGFSRFEGSRSGPLHRWGVGPSIDGLFTQSNFGIVTRMTLWLMPAPEYFQAYFFRCDSAEGLGPLIDALRPLRLNGTLRSTVHVANDYKVLSGLQQYPWEEAAGEAPLPERVMRSLRQRHQFGAWNASGGLYGTRAQVAEARRLLRKALAGRVDKLQFLDERKLRLAERFSKVYRFVTGWDLTRALELVRPVFGLLQGVPTSQPLASTYWRKKSPPPAEMNPDRDGCGLLWSSPVVPADGAQARALVELAGRTLLEHSFEPAISLTMVTERSLACVISIAYDRHVPGEDEKAAACYRVLTGRLAEAGYYSYRLTSQSASSMPASAGYDALLRAFKGGLDPNRILSPGRYQSGE
ncbi:MAG: FAD-binding oxidoreductase [Acidobacteriota bacterium]|nr:FAD-binding oxidoreductase [Acidobacteriota bacterium]